MKKKVLSMILALCMVLTVIPAMAAAPQEQADTGYATGEIPVREYYVTAQGEEVALADDVADSPVSLMSAEDQKGTGFASGDMTAAEFLATAKDRKITLNGNVKLTAASAAVAGMGIGSLTIDLANYQLDINNYLIIPTGNATITGQNSGKIISTAESINTYPIVQLQTAGSLTVKGGTIDGGTTRYAIWAFGSDANSVTIEGGTVTGSLGILTAECCTVNITGGTVRGTTGSGMQNGGEATISGGTVTSQNGSGVVVMGHLVVEEGATIQTEPGSNGTAIQVNATTIDGQDAGVREASAEIKGGTITGNGSGGAVVVNNKSNVTITGGTFTSTGDAERGCAVYIMNNSTVDISAGSITGNNSGIFIAGDSTVTVSGSAEIKGTTGFGISTNGTGDKESLNYGANAVININGGTVTGADTACGVYLPAGTANVTDGTVKGGAGIVVRGGDLDVQGGTIEATGTGNITVGDATKDGKRYEVPAAGITVDNASYPAQEAGQKHVTVGGEAKVKAADRGKTLAACENGVVVGATEEGKVAPENNPFDISGGTFTTGDGEANYDKNVVDQFLPKGNEYKDGEVTYTGEPKVTRNGVKFESLEAALKGAQPGDKLVLEDNIQLPGDGSGAGRIEIDKQITIDLNGHTLTKPDAMPESTSGILIKAGGDLTVTDSTGADTQGKITGKGTLLLAKDGGKLTIEADAKIDQTTGADQSNDTAVAVDTTGELTITGGTITAKESGVGVFGTGKLKITGGTIDATEMGVSTNGSKTDAAAEINITGGNITSSGSAGVYLPAGKMTVSDDAAITGKAGIVQFGGELTVNGGTITANGTEDTITVGDSGQAVTPAAVVTNKQTGYDQNVKATLTDGTFKAAAGKDAVTYTESGTTVDTASALTVEGGNFSSSVNSKLLSDELNYEAKSTDANAPYSYHKTLKDAETAAGTEGTVDVTNVTPQAVTLNGDSSIEKVEMAEDKVVDVTVKVGTIGATEAGSTAGDAHQGDAAFWVGVGLVVPDGAANVEYKRSDSNVFVKNNGTGSLDALTTDGKKGFAAWVNVGGAKEGKNPTATYTLRWLAEDGETVVDEVTYCITFTEVTLKPDVVTPIINAVGFKADADKATEAIEADLGRDLTANDVVGNTMYVVFNLQGTVNTTDGTEVTATFAKGNTTYTEPVFKIKDNEKHVVYFSFDDLGNKVTPENAKLGEGKYTITVTAGNFHFSEELDVYKVVYAAENGEIAGETAKVLYAASVADADEF